MNISLICSSGGHLYELFSLENFWKQYTRFWVTFDKHDVHYLLEQERVYYAYHPTNRHLFNMLRNFSLAWRILKKEGPDVLITTGAGLAVPFIYVAKIFKIHTIYIESLARVENLSLSGKLVYWITDRFYVQWPSLETKYRRAIFRGRVT